MIHPLDKILACLPVGREAFLLDSRISPRFSEALPGVFFTFVPTKIRQVFGKLVLI